MRVRPLVLVLTLAACGGGDDAPPPPPASLSGTLAYVVSECRENSTSGYFFRQSIQIRQGEHDSVTSIEIPEIGPVPLVGICKLASAMAKRVAELAQRVSAINM